jgi:serine/threonine protein kinase
MTVGPGTRLGQFEVLAPLGRGGMGEVYRARDSRLSREVALKILPEALSRDADRVARFEREARVLASLNHPHIASVHGFEQRMASGSSSSSSCPDTLSPSAY